MTSNGEWFDMDYLSAAHATMPLPSYVKVTNLENGRSVVLRVNDRGPFVNDRIIDVSKKARRLLDFHKQARPTFRVTYLGPAVDDKGHASGGHEPGARGRRRHGHADADRSVQDVGQRHLRRPVSPPKSPSRQSILRLQESLADAGVSSPA